MKRILSILIICLAALSGAQIFTYKDKSGTLIVHAASGLVEQTTPDKVHLTLKGSPVVINSIQDGLQIEAPNVVCDTNSTGKNHLGKAVGTGGTHTIKRGADGTTDITAASGTYNSGPQNSRIDLKGNVRIVNKTTKGTTTITGNTGYAILANGSKGPGSGLKSAFLDGPVKIVGDQQNTNGGTITATGSTLTMDNAAHTVTLNGNVNVTGNQKSTLGELRGANRAVLVLNDQGKISSVHVTQGGK